MTSPNAPGRRVAGGEGLGGERGGCGGLLHGTHGVERVCKGTCGTGRRGGGGEGGGEGGLSGGKGAGVREGESPQLCWIPVL